MTDPSLSADAKLGILAAACAKTQPFKVNVGVVFTDLFEELGHSGMMGLPAPNQASPRTR